jgi:hypothetical protein
VDGFARKSPKAFASSKRLQCQELSCSSTVLGWMRSNQTGHHARVLADIAITSLGQGKGSTANCTFTFSFPLTEGQDRYVVSVGRPRASFGPRLLRKVELSRGSKLNREVCKHPSR